MNIACSEKNENILTVQLLRLRNRIINYSPKTTGNHSWITKVSSHGEWLSCCVPWQMEFLIKSTIILESMVLSDLDKGLNIAVVYHFPRYHYRENWLFIM
jgi:hypothetical protein